MFDDILVQVKANLRLSSTAFDANLLNPMIESCKEDLITSGVPQVVASFPESHPLVQRAIVHYCSANFPAGNVDMKLIERHERSYESLKEKLAITAKEVTNVQRHNNVIPIRNRANKNGRTQTNRNK